jgi:hypothetical protein
MAFTITDALNSWNEFGVFSYVIPFLLIFAVVYAVLDKTKLLSGKDDDGNKGIIIIIAIAIALLAIQFDMVSNFFAIIFPRFGIGISIFICFIIFIGFFLPSAKEGEGLKHEWVGWVIGAGVIVWAISSWGEWNATTGVGGWFSEYIWSFIVLGLLI